MPSEPPPPLSLREARSRSRRLQTTRREKRAREKIPSYDTIEGRNGNRAAIAMDLSYTATFSGRAHEFAFVATTCAAQFWNLAAMNQTVAPVLILAEYFRIEDYGTLSWFSAAYSLTVGTFILPAGRLGDIYGHKKVFLLGWLWFGIWSLACGFCGRNNLVLFGVFRACQGIGPALLVPNAIALIGRTFAVGNRRNIAFACFGASGPTGAAVGAVMAALLSELLTWSWSFWILAAVCALMLLIAFFIIPAESPVPSFPASSAVAAKEGEALKAPSFDIVGSLTGVAALVLINFAFNQAPLTGWREPYIIATLAGGCVALGIFVWVELRIASQPLVPVRDLHTDAVFVLACVFAGWSSHGIWAYYLYLLLEHLRGHNALLASAETAPVALTGLLFAFSTVWLVRHMPVSWIMLISMLLFVIGSLLLALVPLEQIYWAQTFVSVLLMPGAMNLSFPAATILLSTALPSEKQGIAASLVTTMVNYSISCGLGLAGTIHRDTIMIAANRAGLGTDQQPFLETTPTLLAIRLTGLRAAYWFSVALGAVGVVVSALFVLISWRKSLVQKKMAARSPSSGSSAESVRL